MKNVLKFLRSRFFFGAVCILLEVLQLWALFIWLYEVFLPVAVVGWALYLGVLLYLINRDELPEMKLLWLAILLLLPHLGAFLLLLISGNSTGKRYCSHYKQAQLQTDTYLQQTDSINRLERISMDAMLQARYLYNAAGMPCWEETDTTYYPTGEDFFQALLRDLEQAETFIFLQYFLLQEGVMWDAVHSILRKKAKQGMQVYVMYDDLGCIALLPPGYFKQLQAEGIHCIPSQKFNAIFTYVHNNRDHRKIAVIDGKIGYTGGINLTDEYINVVQKFGHWKDTAVRLEGAAVKNLSALFLAHWNAQRGELLDPADYLNVQTSAPSQGFVVPFGDGPAPIYPDEVGKNVYINMATSAKDYLYITTPYLICDRALLSALGLAAKKGVDVRLITPHIPDKKTIYLMTRSNYKKLMDDGVKIYEYTPGFIHAKTFLSDDRYGVCGTINLDYRSLVHHFECGMWMFDTDCISAMKEDFLQTLEASQRITPRQARLSLWQRLVAESLKLFSPLL